MDTAQTHKIRAKSVTKYQLIKKTEDDAEAMCLGCVWRMPHTLLGCKWVWSVHLNPEPKSK